MRRKLFNYYKIKKKVNRKIQHSFDDSTANKKDFAWSKKTKSNPYSHKPDKKWKRRVQFFIIIASTITMMGVLFFHHFFYIQNINISGLQRIEEIEFRDSIDGLLDYKRFFLLPNRSYILTDVDEIKDILKSKFPILSITVQKSFPNSLSISVEEELSTIIYDNGQEYSYLGLDGGIVEKLRKIGIDEWNIKTKVTTSTDELGEIISKEEEISREHILSVKNIINEMGDYPIVYYINGPDGEINDVVLQENTVNGIIEWFNLINRQTDIPFGYIIIENEVGDAVIKTREGWYMNVKVNKNIETQFESLQTVLRDKVTRPNFNYIDLRYKSRVFWQ
jgi:cell division septal protein FtsQ